jgi:DNA sulfur modification protein DndB
LGIKRRETNAGFILFYFNGVKEIFNKEWLDYGEYRITHIVCLHALAIAGADVLQIAVNSEKKHIDYNKITRRIKKMQKVDWSTTGALKYIKGINGSKALASDLKVYLLEEN